MESLLSSLGGYGHSITVSIICGAIVGLERQIRGKPAGIRTAILICLGTSLFVHMGANINGEMVDASRVLGQVVTGVGFLGAGVMFTREGVVTGVTTASVIWVLAAIGSLIGLGQYEVAYAMAFVTVLILSACEFLERTFHAMRRGVHARKGFNSSNERAEEECE